MLMIILGIALLSILLTLAVTLKRVLKPDMRKNILDWKRIGFYYPEILFKVDYKKRYVSFSSYDGFHFTIKLIAGRRYRITGKIDGVDRIYSQVKVLPKVYDPESLSERYNHSITIIKNELCPHRFASEDYRREFLRQYMACCQNG